QLILPDSTERKENALCLQKLGAGAWLPAPQWQPGLIADALGRLVSDSEVRTACRELAARVHSADPVAAACDLIEGCMSDADRATVGDAGAPEVADRGSRIPPRDNAVLEMTAALSAERLALLNRRLKGKRQL